MKSSQKLAPAITKKTHEQRSLVMKEMKAKIDRDVARMDANTMAEDIVSNEYFKKHALEAH